MLGHLGKEKMLRVGILSYSLRPRAVLALGMVVGGVVAACSTDLPHKYVGDLQPVAGTCEGGNRAALARTGSSVVFEPHEGVILLRGTLSGNGEVAASLEMPGMNHIPFRLIFAGHVDGDRIIGTYTTRHCSYSVTLRGASD